MLFLRLSVAVFGLAFGLVLGAPARSGDVGFQLERFEDVERARPLLIDWWYPADGSSTAEPINYGLGQGVVVEAGDILAGEHPLVVLSHGAFGAARNYAWIAEALARDGFVVAGVSHYGESYVYGPETVDPLAVLRVRHRPLDISAALDFIEQRSRFKKAVDQHRIGFLGHSSGGATAFFLAGALFDEARIANYCVSETAAQDKGCDYAEGANLSGGSAKDEAGLNGYAKQSYADSRISSIVALDPALGPGFYDFSGISPTLRSLIVGSTQNDFLPFAHHAARFAKALPNSETYWLRNGEGHFVFLNECTLAIEANGVPLCKDDQGVSRAQVHARLSVVIREFFRDQQAPGR